jgi:hypothetical protein
MYYDNAIVSIEQIETSLPISVSSLRTDTNGVTFTNAQQPTLLVEVDYTVVSYIISISIPLNNGGTNVNQIKVAFYGIDGQILQNSLGEDWIVETTPGVTTVCLICYFIE